MSEALEALGINGPFLLSQIVNFLILFIGLRLILWKPLMKRLEERREMLQQQREDAEAAEEARAEIEEERQKILDQGRQEADQILDEAQDRTETLREQTLQEARQEAERITNEAEQEAIEERNRILGEMRSHIASLATAAAQRIISQELDEHRQRALVDSFFSGIREGHVEVLPEQIDQPRDGVISVTSAVPLTGEEQSVIRDELSSRVEGSVDINFQVDPDLLGGLIIQSGTRVIDSSVIGQLERMQDSIT